MNVRVELGIFESAIMQGDFDRIVMRLDRKIRHERDWRTMAGHKEDSEGIKFMQALRDVITGQIKVKTFSERLLINSSFTTVPGHKECLDRIVYYLEYCSDRYNLEYPRYNQKRCNDL